MTATEMGQAFLRQINQEHNFAIESWTIASWLNKAQLELFNELFYNRNKKRAVNDTPPNAFEDSLYIARSLGPFKRVVETNSNAIGFIEQPTPPASQTFAHYTAIGVRVANTQCPEETLIYEATYLRDGDLFATLADPFDRPRFADTSTFIPYKFYYTEITLLNNATAQYVQGIQLFPNRVLDVQIQYLVQPPAIAIENFPLEASLYSTNPDYIATPADIDSLFPSFLHEELVTRAVALYSKSTPDYEQYQVEESKIQSGQV